MPKRALVREPSSSYKQCVSSHPLHHTVDLGVALEQHTEYCKTLSDLGLELIKLPPDDKYPDSCFVEDNAVVFKNKALITRMGVESRRGEEDEVAVALKDYFEIKKAEAPATIEGGDVIHLPDRLICGITQRTNLEGTKQLGEWLEVTVDVIQNPDIVHLKSYMKYLGKNTIITTEQYENHPFLDQLEKLIVPKEDYYSVNCLAIGDTIIMSNRFSNTQRIVKEAGYEVITLEMSEFEKCQASLTCLSILF